MTAIKIGELSHAKLLAKGDWLHDAVGDIRVMAVVDGWAMCRRPGCIPFVVDLKRMTRGSTPVLVGRAREGK